MQLHGGLGPAKLGPRKQLQTEIYGGGVQRVNRLRQVGNTGVLGVQLSRLGNQHLGEVGEDPPVAAFVGVGQRGATNVAANAQVVELGRDCLQTGFDVSQTLAAGQLGEYHAQELVETRKGAIGVALWVSSDTTAEIGQRQQVHDLREHQSPHMHAAPCQGAVSPQKGHSPLKSIHAKSMKAPSELRMFMTFRQPLTGQQCLIILKNAVRMKFLDYFSDYIDVFCFSASHQNGGLEAQVWCRCKAREAMEWQRHFELHTTLQMRRNCVFQDYALFRLFA